MYYGYTETYVTHLYNFVHQIHPHSQLYCHIERRVENRIRHLDTEIQSSHHRELMVEKCEEGTQLQDSNFDTVVVS